MPCSGAWEYRAIDSFEVTGQGDYPSEDYLSEAAFRQCDSRFTYFLYPLRESWEYRNDRTISCLQHSFGLAETDPAKLDRLVAYRSLSEGDCFNEAPETDGLLVESVPCDSVWETRVVSVFSVPDADVYPGEDYLDQAAYRQCDRRYTYFFFPAPDTWLRGDRVITCVQESFGLAGTDPAKLDRLVDLSRLSVGECYSEAPETDGYLVELVDCSGDWEYRVVDIFFVPPGDTYPGDNYFQDLADSRCAMPWDYFYSPNSQTWERGDREVMCIRTP